MLTVLNAAYPFAPVGVDAVGGAEQILTAVERAAARAGHRSLVLAAQGSSATGTLFSTPRVEGTLTPERRAEGWLEYGRVLGRILDSERVDLIHFHGVDFSEYLPARPVPVLATLHLPPAWYPRGIFRPSRPHTFLNCVSSSQRRSCPPSPVLLDDVPNGVELARFRLGPPLARRGDYALVLGRICPEKGIHLAIRAARRAKMPLLVAGEVFAYEEHRRYFHERVEPELDEDRRFIGPVGRERKVELLAGARCLLVPSLVQETSSLVTLEALASGTPVIASRRGALTELITHGRTGFLVRTVAEMAEAMIRSEQLRPEDCRAAAEPFSAEAMCDRYLALYEHVASSGRAVARPRPAPALTLEEHRALPELEALAPEWESLASRCPDATTFQSPAWLIPWCRYLLGGELRLLTLRRGARLVGLAPWFLWRDGGAGVISGMGAGVSDYVDVLAEPDQGPFVAEALEGWLQRSGACARSEWSEVRAGSLLLRLRGAGARSALSLQDVCPGVRLSARRRLEALVAPSFWTRLAYARRRTAREGGVIEDAMSETLEAVLDRLDVLLGARWGARGRSPWPRAALRSFQLEASRNLLQRGALALVSLRIRGALAAVFLGFREPRATRYYLGGFEAGEAQLSPGNILVAHVLERALEAGAETFDFLRGAEPYKYAWGAEDLTSLFRRTSW